MIFGGQKERGRRREDNRREKTSESKEELICHCLRWLSESQRLTQEDTNSSKVPLNDHLNDDDLLQLNISLCWLNRKCGTKSDEILLHSQCYYNRSECGWNDLVMITWFVYSCLFSLLWSTFTWLPIVLNSHHFFLSLYWSPN